MNHSWDESNKCRHCGLERKMRTSKLLMAIDRGRDYYRYERKYAYSFDLKKWSFTRPDCKIVKKEMI